MAVREFKPATCANDVFDWITPEEVVRLALGAFYGECTRWRAAPDPEAVLPDWYSRGGFLDGLADRLALRLRVHAHDLGVVPDSRSAALEAHHQAFPDWVTPFEFKPAISA